MGLKGAPLRERAVQVAGVRSPVLEAGPPAAEEAVVFVHGNPGSSRDWEELVGRVGEFGRAVALDMPGFGRADKPDDFAYTVEGYARHLGGCLAELGVRRAHLVLHDFGGPWGLAWAAADPDAFASATLINTGIWPAYRWHRYARIWRTPILGEIFMATVTRPGFHLAVQYGNPRRLPRRFVDRMYDDYDRGTRRAILRLYRATDDPSRLGHDLAAASGGQPLSSGANATRIYPPGWPSANEMRSQMRGWSSWGTADTGLLWTTSPACGRRCSHLSGNNSLADATLGAVPDYADASGRYGCTTWRSYPWQSR